MKIRSAFVANSSSSSFLIAIKDLKTAELANIPKWILALAEKSIKMITNGADQSFRTKEELNAFFVDNWGLEDISDVLGDDDYLLDKYKAALFAIKSGYEVKYFDLDNCDSMCEILEDLPCKDTGDGIFLVCRDNG